ncbi:MAG: dihydroorotate dehydrogenase electron transfer subunit [Pseudomonadota bacterium]
MMDMKLNVAARKEKVLRCDSIHPLYFVLHVSNTGGRPCSPGQFAMLRLPDTRGESFMLSRPFSVMMDGRETQFLVKIAGRGTRIMSTLKKGDDIMVLHPLGNPFPRLSRFEHPLLVAGGTGVAPLLFLAREESKAGRPRCVLYGARSGEDLVLRELLEPACSLSIATEDGSEGAQGFVTLLLEDALKNPAVDAVLACGPTPLLVKTAKLSMDRGLECFVSVETLMGCGFGACLGCAVPKTGGGYLNACTDGPVLSARDIDWEKFT